MKEMKTDLDKYFYELHERHFRRLVYRFEDTITHAGNKNYSTLIQTFMIMCDGVIVGEAPFTAELRANFIHHYKIDKRKAISGLLPTIETMQREFVEKRQEELQKINLEDEKLERQKLKYEKYFEHYTPEEREKFERWGQKLGIWIYKILVFLKIRKPLQLRMEYAEPLAFESDNRKIVKSLV